MSSGINTYWMPVERWSPTLFLVGGALLVGHAAVQGIEAFTAITPPPDVFVTTGHLVGLLGLVGLYPGLVDRTPRLARAAVAVGTVALVGWSAMTVSQFAVVAGTAASIGDVLPGAVVALVLGSLLLAYVLFGVATIRAGSSRTVGALVLAPAALVGTLPVVQALGVEPALAGLGVGGGLALSMLALGYRLRTWDRSPPTATGAGDATVG